MEILAQAQAFPEWFRLIEGVTSIGLIGFVVWYVFSKQMPAREEATRQAQAEARKDYLGHLEGARSDYIQQLDGMRNAFLTEIERQRVFYKESYDRLHQAIEKQSEILQLILERGKVGDEQ